MFSVNCRGEISARAADAAGTLTGVGTAGHPAEVLNGAVVSDIKKAKLEEDINIQNASVLEIGARF